MGPLAGFAYDLPAYGAGVAPVSSIRTLAFVLSPSLFTVYAPPSNIPSSSGHSCPAPAAGCPLCVDCSPTHETLIAAACAAPPTTDTNANTPSADPTDLPETIMRSPFGQLRVCCTLGLGAINTEFALGCRDFWSRKRELTSR